MQKPKYNFFLNKYSFYGATKCTSCDTKTNVRKFPLFISLDKNNIYTLNLSCKFCTRCNLIIAKKDNIDKYISIELEQKGIAFDPDNYFVMGTIDSKTFWRHNKGNASSDELFDNLTPFKKVLDFEIRQAGWYKD